MELVAVLGRSPDGGRLYVGRRCWLLGDDA